MVKFNVRLHSTHRSCLLTVRLSSIESGHACPPVRETIYHANVQARKADSENSAGWSSVTIVRAMKWLIGLDEAGYGPNLGPLVVALSVWRTSTPTKFPHATTPIESATTNSRLGKRTARRKSNVTACPVVPFDDSRLFERLHPEIACRDQAKSESWLLVDDSKRLYSGGHTLEPLERVVLGATMRGIVPATIARLREQLLSPRIHGSVIDRADRSVQPTNADSRRMTMGACVTEPEGWRRLGRWSIDSVNQHDQPWYPSSYPLEPCVDLEALLSIADRFERLMKDRQVQLESVAARQVEPLEFNAACESWGNKASVLSLTSLSLARDALERLPDENGAVLCRCDRHGGRARYAALLQTVFPDSWINIAEESPRVSRYCFVHEGREVEMRFEVHGERFLETAWASIHAKYLRELAMDQLNDFWKQLVPGLPPTKGYPTDAKRYRAAIEAAARAEGIEPPRYWRAR